MKNIISRIKYFRLRSLLVMVVMISCQSGIAQIDAPTSGFEMYGYIKTDVGYNFNQADPNWPDILRVTKLPQYKDQFGPDGKIYFSIRETRLGFNHWVETALGRIRTNFEFDLFGVGNEVGQTAFHFRKAYIAVGRFSVGQNQSLFTDVEVTPNTLDFGAPPSRPFLRSIQVRYMVQNDRYKWGIALEQPGATSDEGIYAERLELEDVRAAFRLPDLTGQYRKFTSGGYVEVGGVLKWIRWENIAESPIDLSGEELGWGMYISTTQQLGSATIVKGQLVYGKDMENYLTDAGPDIGIENNPGSVIRPVLGVALPVYGGLLFVEHNWTDKLGTTAGYSAIRIQNSDAQTADAFKLGNYGIVNLRYTPIPQFMTGVELQYGQRTNFYDGFSSSAVRLQFSCKYNIAHTFK